MLARLLNSGFLFDTDTLSSAKLCFASFNETNSIFVFQPVYTSFFLVIKEARKLQALTRAPAFEPTLVWRALESEVGTSGNPATPRVGRDEAGPSHPPAIVPNSSLETSLRNRIVSLENDQTLFLLDKKRGEYWSEIKNALDQAPDQREYNRLLDFENRDLQIRELQHKCYSMLKGVLSEHPDLAENEQYKSLDLIGRVLFIL